jgi:hypothetical protein
MPWTAAARCLEKAGCEPANLEAVALAQEPGRFLSRATRSALAGAPSGWDGFARDCRAWVAAGLWVGPRLRRRGFSGPLMRVGRLEALARGVPRGPGRAAVVVAGAEAEDACDALGVVSGEAARITAVLEHPHGLAALWRAFGSYLGARDPWKELLELARGGEPGGAAVFEQLLDLKGDGSLRLDLGYLDEPARLHALLGGPPLPPGAAPEKRHRDLAASLRSATVLILRRMAAEARRRAGAQELVLAGPAAALRAELDGAVRAGGPPEAVAAAAGAADAAWARLRRGPLIIEPSAWGDAQRVAAEGEPGPAARLPAAVAYFGAIVPVSLVGRLLGAGFRAERLRASGSYWARPR